MKNIITLFKNAFGGLSKEVWLISWSTFINRSGTMVIMFLSVYLTEHLHYKVQQAGVVMALFGAGSFAGVFISGKLTDKIGFYPIMLVSLIAGGFMFIVVSFVKAYWLMCIAIFVLSFIAEAFRPPTIASLSVYSTPETYTRSVSLYRLAINLGFSIGPAIGGWIAMHNYQLIFWADGITCLGAAILLYYFLPRKEKTSTEKKESDVIVKSAYTDKPYLVFIFLNMLYAMSFFQFFSTMPLYYKTELKLNEGQIGWILALNGVLVAAIEMVLIYKIENRWNKFYFISLGAAMLVVSYVSLLFLPYVWWMYVLIIIISFSEMFAMPFMNAFMNARTNESNRGQYAALYVMSWSAAQIILPIFATQTIANMGYDMLWIFFSVICLSVTLGILWVKKMAEV